MTPTRSIYLFFEVLSLTLELIIDYVLPVLV